MKLGIGGKNKQEQEMLWRLAAIVESADDAIIGKALDGTIVSWNRGAERIYGYSANEVIGKPISILVEPDHPDEVPKILDRIKRGETIEHYETVRVGKGGKRINASLTISPIKDASGKIIGVSTIGRDITGRKKMEENLRATTLYARSLIEASLDPLVTISPEGKITDVNEATVKVTGTAREKLIGTDFSDYFTEPAKAREGYQTVFKKGFVTDYPLTIRHTSGKVTEVLYNASVYKDEAGNVLGVFAAARDVTQQKKMEEELRATSSYARSLIEASLDPLVTISPEGKITDVNETTVKVTGVAREKLIGTDFSDYFTEPAKAREGYQTVFKKGFVTDYPLTIRHTSGKLTDVLYNASVYKDEAGNVIGVFAAARDVTQQKKMEEESRIASLYARSLIEASLDPLVTISPEGKITDVNETTVKVAGVAREKLIGTDFSDYFTEPAKAREGYQTVFRQGFVADYPLTLRHTSGKLTDVLYNASVYKDEAGNVLGVFAAARDVTQQKKMEEELRKHREHLEETVAQRTSELTKVLKEVKEVTNVLAISASEILAAATQVATGTTETAIAVSETTTTVEEVKQTAQVSNQKAKYVSESAQKATQVAQSGKKAVEESISGMNRIREQMESIAESAVRLSEQGQAIGEIAATVTDIAEQVNLLSVNAAIEAARAGEQGRGFTVVAQEVKSLAEQAKQATAQVRTILNDVQRGISAAVMVTEQGTKAAEAGAKQATEAGEAIRLLTDNIAEASQAATQVAASSQQQLVGMDQVASAMESIKQASVEATSSTKQAETSARSLHDLSQKMKELVEQIKV